MNRWKYRWGVTSFRCSTWLYPGHLLTREDMIVGFRTRNHGWLIMPLHRFAEWTA
jgi:hypothetical protein